MKRMRKKLALLLVLSLFVSPYGNYGIQGTKVKASKTEVATETVVETQDGHTLVDYKSPTKEEYEEMREMPTGAILGEEEQKNGIETVEELCEELNEDASADSYMDMVSYPSEVDNSTNENAKYFPPIINQKGGSCACASHIYLMGTYTINKARDIASVGDENLINPYYMFNLMRGGVSTSNGCLTDDVAEAMAEVGAPTMDLIPDTSKQFNNYSKSWYPTEEIWTDASNNRVSSVEFLKMTSLTGTPITSANDSDLNTYKAALASGKLLGISTDIYTWNYSTIPSSSSHGGEWVVDRCDNEGGGGHAMVIVGYDDTIWTDINHDGVAQKAEYGAFKIANSWGTGYKNNGFVWAAYDAFNKVSAALTEEDVTRINNAVDANLLSCNKVNNARRCTLARYNVRTYTMDKESTASNCLLVADVETADRYHTQITIRAKKNNTTVGSYTFSTYRYWSGDYSYSGSISGATEDTLVFDLNQVVKDITAKTVKDYQWSVEVKDTDNDLLPVIVNDLRVKANGTLVLESADKEVSLENETRTFSLEEVREITVTDLVPSKASGKVTEGQEVVFTASANYSDNVEYQFVYDSGMSEEIIRDYDKKPTVTWNSKHSYYNSGILVNVKDLKTGKIASKRIDYKVAKPLFFSGVLTVPSTMTIGDTHQILISGQGGAGTLTKVVKVSYNGGNVQEIYRNTSASNCYWSPKQAGEYHFYYYLEDENGATIVYESDCTVEDSEYKVTLTSNKGKNIGLTEEFTLTANTNKANQEYEYRFGSVYQGKEYYFLGGETSGTITTSIAMLPGFVSTADKVGTHTLFVDVTLKGSNTTVRSTIDNIVVEGLKITSFTASVPAPQKVGTTIKLSTTTENESGYRYNAHNYYAIKDGVSTKLNVIRDGGSGLAWTPTEPGTYTLKYEVWDSGYDQYAEKTMEYTIIGDNTSTVYYANSSWSNAYIHYKVGNGNWTTVPGVKMANSSEQNGYTWKYEIDLKDAENATVCFNNGNGAWDSKNGTNYIVKAGIYGIKNQNVYALTVPTKTPIVTATPTTIPTQTPVITETPVVTSTPTPVFEIEEIHTSVASPQKIGTGITLSTTVNNVGYLKPHSGYTFSYEIKKNGQVTANYSYTEGAGGELPVWTPEEAGVYEITVSTLSQYGIAKASKTITYVIKEDNLTTVYYQTNWNAAYVHYKVGNGSWTNVPGVAMEKSSDVDGYTWKYEIDLKEEKNVTLCFNNGNNTWDSKNGSNYVLEAGTYGIKNGNIETLQLDMAAKVSLNRASTEYKGDITANISVTNGVAPYTYYYTWSYNGVKQGSNIESKENKYTFSGNYTGNYQVSVKVVDAQGKEATAAQTINVGAFTMTDITASISSPVKTGTKVEFSAKVQDEMLYKNNKNTRTWSVKNVATGAETQYTTEKLTWTPSTEGVYEITCTSKDPNGETATKTISYTVKNSNTVTIYYKNSSYSNAYIHYKVNNGSWTSVPGVKMQESDKAGYTWMYTIDLGTETGATICFNNGNNVWDSKNGANYSVGVGAYGISSQNVTSLN